MSKIGKLPIKLPKEVNVDISDSEITLKGPKGEFKKVIPEGISVELKEGSIQVSLKKKSKDLNAIYGTTRAHIANMVHGVAEGWSKTLELVGAGYRAELKGKDLILNVGYSHPVEIKALEGISYKVEKAEITVEGVDKALVGQFAAKIRDVRPPEPYKGKGIKYKDEVIRRKPGKAAKTEGAAG